jgi:uracil-DNA glycosylase family 4
VPGEGSEKSRLVFVGEAPGAREDESGRPFVGRSGQLLASMIERIGLKREEVFITSILKCRPPGNRAPLKSEVDTCLPYLKRQIDAISPEFVVLLGGVAISSLIGPRKVSDAHGRFYEDDARTYFMTYHPAAALRFPKIGDRMRADFRILMQELLGA